MTAAVTASDAGTSVILLEKSGVLGGNTICAANGINAFDSLSMPGISLDSAMEVLAEISPDPQKSFSAPEKLCKWAGLVPRNDGSADTITCRKTLHGNPYVKSILVQCAWAAVKKRDSEFQKWFWPRQCRLGRKKAIIAVARKLLYILYTLLARGVLYSPSVLAHQAV